MISRSEVYRCIDSERDYQDQTYPIPLTCGEHIVLMNKYVQDLTRIWASPACNEGAVDVFRKLAAISVSCMENHGVVYRSVLS